MSRQVNVTRNEFLESYKKHYALYLHGDRRISPKTRRLILFYSVECGLKSLVLKNIGKDTYEDLKTSEIRKAIEPCSIEKLGEIKTEMKSIYSILEKFLKMEPGQKQLPMTLDKIALTGEEIARLESQGYLKIADKKYYLPEIIRLSLGFQYEKGARPKVLSLLVQ